MTMMMMFLQKSIDRSPIISIKRQHHPRSIFSDHSHSLVECHSRVVTH